MQQQTNSKIQGVQNLKSGTKKYLVNSIADKVDANTTFGNGPTEKIQETYELTSECVDQMLHYRNRKRSCQSLSFLARTCAHVVC